MECKNHQDVSATDRCTGCAEAFCGDCLVEMHGQKYCGACKVLAVKGDAVFEEEPSIPCKEANEALILAVVSIFCCGIILSPLSLIKADKARKMIAEDSRLQGSGKVTAAILISSLALILSILNVISRVMAMSSRGP